MEIPERGWRTGLTWTGHKGPWGRNICWTCDQVSGLLIKHCGHPTASRPYYINRKPWQTFRTLSAAKAAAARLAGSAQDCKSGVD